jgi:hypothetical protein
MKFTAGRGWGSACSLLTFPCGFLQFASIGQQRSVIHELAPDVIKIASTERHASTKFFALWKSFQKFFRGILISTAKKNFCQVARSLMQRELCRNGRGSRVIGRWQETRRATGIQPREKTSVGKRMDQLYSSGP